MREDLIIVDNGTKTYEDETSAYMDRQLEEQTHVTHEKYKKAFVPLFEDRNLRFLRARQTCQEFFTKKTSKKEVSVEVVESNSR